MAIPFSDVVTWIGYLLYLLGFLALWVYGRDQRNLNTRVSEIEKTRPTAEQVQTLIKAAFYEDGRR